MREIKFRVYDIKNNVMLNVDSLFINEQMFKAQNKSEYDVFNFDTDYYSKIMQYTGLKDKNGVEIYEGDIVKVGYPYTETNAKVIFNNGQFYPDSKCESIYFRYWNSECELIGNIYENPEMI